MNDLLNSPFFNNLKAGKLPEVEVSFQTSTVVNIAAALLMVGLTLIVASKIVSKL